MRGTVIGVLLASLGVGSGFGWAAPPVSPSARTEVRIAAPVTIDSEASLEFFIAAAARLLQSDHAKDLALLKSQLDALKGQKQAIAQKMLEVQRQTAGAEAAHDAALTAKLGVQLDTLKAQLAKTDVAIKDIVQQIQRLRDEEEREQDDIKHAEENLRALDQQLAASADRYRTAIADVSSMAAFVRRLSAEKRRETESRVRQALAQLAEARRARLSQLSTLSDPTFRPVPKPLTTR